MKKIGLIGGLGPESTMYMYNSICSEYNKRFKLSNFPLMSIISINLQEIADLIDAGKIDEMAHVIASEICNLEKSGAKFAAIASNTPHVAYDLIQKLSPIYVMDIMNPTAKEIKKDGFTKVGLLGTKGTMEMGFYQRILGQYNIQTLIPDKSDRDYIHKVIFDELVHGKTLETSKKNFIEIIEKLEGKGAQGIILGCTELPIWMKSKDSPVKLYDTATIYALAILDYALQDEGTQIKTKSI